MCIRDRVSTQSTWGEVKFFAFGRSFTSVAFMNTEKITLTFVTGNAKKLKELRSIVGEDKFNLLNEDIDLPELQGEPELIAKEKCKIAFEKIKKPVITEDTSLCYSAFKGLPGPYIKWFLEKLGPQGLYKMVEPFDDHTAYAMTVFSYMDETLPEPLQFIGKTYGTIVEPRPKEGSLFGWDPIFQPDGKTQTYAEMPFEEKNTISHRYRSIKKLIDHFTLGKSEQTQIFVSFLAILLCVDFIVGITVHGIGLKDQNLTKQRYIQIYTRAEYTKTRQTLRQEKPNLLRVNITKEWFKDEQNE
eukprot:TRINITY_DN517_c0_g1_i10.p1 TRINITY_DN517_c0_g1~~TRINITY_DN517_c0_g1_i10.p1  ORF type:complete len:301 (+),score=34.60 TRINITY_DN517_c0_g1_i10:66-968(+)